MFLTLGLAMNIAVQAAVGDVQTQMRFQAAGPVDSFEVRPAPEAAQPDPVEVAITAAEAQIGTPYRWGGTSPGGFDCSGFVLFSFRAAGIELPRTSGAQLATVPSVPLAEIRRGDLVFSGPGRVNHVGIYLGDGLMVHSPRSGRVVAVDPLHTDAFAAGRPVGP